MDSPISRLPTELLAAVFLSDYYLEVKVSHVSRQWRTTALATHRLWSTLNIGFQLTSIDAIKAYIARSAPLALDVTIFNNGPSSGWRTYGIAGCAAVFQQISRIRVLRIISIETNTLNDILRMLPPFALQLEELEIQNDDNDLPTTPESIPIFPSGAPQLTTLLLDAVPLTNCKFSLNNITSYSWTSHIPSPDSLHELPAIMPALAHLGAPSCDTSVAPDRSVTISVDGSSDWLRFFFISTIIMPSPTSISLRNFRDAGFNSLKDILEPMAVPIPPIDSVQAAMHSVHTLELVSCHTHYFRSHTHYFRSHTPALLRAFPALTTLKLVGGYLDDFLHGLTQCDYSAAARDEPCVLPLLNRLVLDEDRYLDYNTFAGVVNGRATVGVPLAELAISASFADKLDTEAHDALRAELLLEIIE